MNENEFDNDYYDKSGGDKHDDETSPAGIPYPYHLPPYSSIPNQSKHIAHSHSLNLYNFSLYLL